MAIVKRLVVESERGRRSDIVEVVGEVSDTDEDEG